MVLGSRWDIIDLFHINSHGSIEPVWLPCLLSAPNYLIKLVIIKFCGKDITNHGFHISNNRCKFIPNVHTQTPLGIHLIPIMMGYGDINRTINLSKVCHVGLSTTDKLKGEIDMVRYYSKFTKDYAWSITCPQASIGKQYCMSKGSAIRWRFLMNTFSNPFCVCTWGTWWSTQIPNDHNNHHMHEMWIQKIV